MADSTEGTVVATIPQAPASALITYSITLKQPPAAPPPDPHWTAYATAVTGPGAAVIAAVIAGGIAYKNWRTAQNKLKLDLFEHRRKVFQAVLDARMFMLDWRIPDSTKELEDNLAVVGGGRWLFSGKLKDELEDFVRQGFRFVQLREGTAPGVTTPADEKAAFIQLRTFLREEFRYIPQKFDPYMTIKE